MENLYAVFDLSLGKIMSWENIALYITYFHSLKLIREEID